MLSGPLSFTHQWASEIVGGWTKRALILMSSYPLLLWGILWTSGETGLTCENNPTALRMLCPHGRDLAQGAVVPKLPIPYQSHLPLPTSTSRCQAHRRRPQPGGACGLNAVCQLRSLMFWDDLSVELLQSTHILSFLTFTPEAFIHLFYTTQG